MRKSAIFFLIFLSSNFLYSRNDTLKFIENKNPFWEEIKNSSDEFLEKQFPKKKEKLTLKMDFTGIDLPKSIDEFTKVWHNDPVPQARTNICWDFCATSMFESEIFRIHKRKIKLSEAYVAYWEFVEKAKYFVQTRGNSLFAEGSQANAVKRIWKQYGVVPYEVYTGLLPGQKYLDHQLMFKEMSEFLKNVKQNQIWNEDFVVSTIKQIMNKYMLEPPQKFNFEGKEYTPVSFLRDVVKLNLDEYVDVISILEPGYYKQIAYDVPDNWWNDQSYYNLPLPEFMEAIKTAIKSGYSLALGGDVSEPGYYSFEDVAMVPSWDIPSQFIDDKARQFRFSNGTTTDDHGVHLVGYTQKDNGMWFLIKDSGSGARNGKAVGYYFYHEDYIKLKMMVFMVHRSAIEKFLVNFKK